MAVNDVFTDISSTLYPTKIDSRTPVAEVRTRSGVLVATAAQQYGNADLTLNIDYNDYVKAGDVNVLQDSIIVIQRVLGTIPQGSFPTVSARILNLESKDYDARYIYKVKPSSWAYNGDTDTLYTHKHIGDGASGPSKIDLTAEVRNKLPKSSVQLTYGVDASPILGTDIRTSSSDERSLAEVVGNQFPRSAGSSYPVTGDLYINQRFYSSMYAEWDASDFTAVGNKVADADCYSGYTARMPSGANWFISGPGSGYTKLRYGKYVIGFRIKLTAGSTLTGTTVVCKVAAGPVTPSNAESVTTKKTVSVSDFESAGNYEMIYMTFDHKLYSGQNKVYFGVYADSSTGTAIDVDSIVIMPSHTSVYDD